ncbi:MAG: ABC transporter ATP-binding protein [Rubrivivax sp.]|jgi:ABC-type branched-subunit amino acid transport system ATPase component|nr:ABC transporter ATP-binding protein [Rubrivivax sp.]
MTLLSLHEVDAYYGEAKILNAVSLEIGAGERVAILGRNGVGKTTVVNACLGIARVRSGAIAFHGVPQSAIKHFTAARCGIAVVPQGRRIVPGLTVRENLALGAAVNRPGKWNFDTVCELFPILLERADTPGTAMSGGQQQMLAIGRALMANPDLLMLDEPSEGLAPVIVDELAATLVRLAAEKTSILLIEQNFSLVHRVAQRYYVLSKGTVVEKGSAQGMSIENLKKHVAV